MGKQKKIAEILIEGGANLNIKDEFVGKTLLIKVMEEKDTELLKLLIDGELILILKMIDLVGPH